MSLVYLLLGTNLGDRLTQLSKAFQEIEKEVGCVLKSSSIYQTSAWGVKDEPPYLNQVLCLETELKSHKLLTTINLIEEKLGRTRKLKWESRLIDIDILFYDNQVIDSPNLIIPHPYLHQRKFTLVPLAEIAADLIHPLFKKTIQELLIELNDPSDVEELTSIS